MSPPSQWAVGDLRQGTSLGVDMSAQSRQQTSDSTKFSGFPQKAILEDLVFHMVNLITLTGDDRGENVDKVIDELDNQAQSTRDGHPATKLQA